MQRHRWLVVVLVLASLGLTACSGSSATLGEASGEAADVVPVQGTELSQVTLTADAYERIGVRTELVRGTATAARSASAVRAIIPASAVWYDEAGSAWTYVREEKRTFVRSSISVDHFDGRLAYLDSGPAPGTPVVVVGVPELFGAEQGVDGE